MFSDHNPLTSDMLRIVSYKTLGELPNPFIYQNGKKLTQPAEWANRRTEISTMAVDFQFGTIPPPPEYFNVELLSLGKNQRSYKIHAGTEKKHIDFLMKVIMPAGTDRPFIIDGDLCSPYFTKEGFLEAALSNDIGWVLFDRTELAHDVVGEGSRQGELYQIYPEYQFGALGAWAWGYSRCIDALVTLCLPQVDIGCLAVTGHSRGGKAALLAGAIDQRIAIVNPNEACLGGSGCYRIQIEGDYLDLPRWRSETLEDILSDTDFWFGPDMKSYCGRAEDLPFDAHYLKAMVAPRILFDSEAAGDVWANPVGSWMTTIAAKEVYKFLSAEQNLFWYFRPGTHYHTAQDIGMLVNIILKVHDAHLIRDDFFRLPFTPVDLAFSWRNPLDEK